MLFPVFQIYFLLPMTLYAVSNNVTFYTVLYGLHFTQKTVLLFLSISCEWKIWFQSKFTKPHFLKFLLHKATKHLWDANENIVQKLASRMSEFINEMLGILWFCYSLPLASAACIVSTKCWNYVFLFIEHKNKNACFTVNKSVEIAHLLRYCNLIIRNQMLIN